MSHSPVHAGIDVSQSLLVVSISGKSRSRFPNTAAGIRKFIRNAEKIPGLVVCCEASGGYEADLVEACQLHNIPVAVVAPLRVRQWASSQNILAKTDDIDADTILNFATHSKLHLRQTPDPKRKKLQHLSRFRQFQTDRLVDLKNRVASERDPFLKRVGRSEIRETKKRIQSISREMKQVVDSDPKLRSLVARMTVPKGIGPVTALTVIAELPLIGQLGPQAVSALSGLAPFNRDSGKFKGRRCIRGGNQRVRRVLYMAALTAAFHNPLLIPFYQRLIQSGKDAKLALIAVARKIIRLLERIAADPTFQPTR